jgi:arylsulfatase A-like enzyme
MMPGNCSGSPLAPVAPQRPVLASCFVPGILLAALFAAGVVGVQAIVAIYSGSFLGLSIILYVTAFWTVAAVAAAFILSLVLLPVVLFIANRARSALLPVAVLAAGFILHALLMRVAIAGKDALGQGFLVSVPSVCVFGLLTSILTAALALRTGWTAYPVAAASMLFSAGMSYFVWPAAAALVLAAGPLALVAITGAMAQSFKSRSARAALAPVFAVVFVGIFVMTARARGQRPLEPVIRPPASAPLPQASGSPARPNVVIIVLDTMRADQTSLCGYKNPTTPNLQALAADCQFYPRGVSTDSSTLPAHGSLFTGKYPRENGARSDTRPGPLTMESIPGYCNALAPSQTALATCLARAGYRTAGIVSNYSRLCRQLGFDQGFQYYHDMPRVLIYVPGGSPVFTVGLDLVDRLLGRNGKLVQPFYGARAVTRLAQSRLEANRDTPFFLFLNYMDAHYPYSAPPPFDRLDGPGIPYNLALRHRSWQAIQTRYCNSGQGLTPALLREALNQYHGALAYEDFWVAQLIGSLKSAGLYDNTLIVITSDHGEFFGEHQLIDHGLELYEEGIRIPILVKYPGGAHAGEVRTSRVSILDIFATVFDVVGLPLPDVTAQPLDRVTHPILSENYESGLRVPRFTDKMKRTLTVIYSGDWKYTHSTSGKNELYNLADDPREETNLVDSRPDVAAKLEAEVSDWFAATPLFEPPRPGQAPAAPHVPAPEAVPDW